MEQMQGRLTRSETDRRIAGVAGGLGEYFGIDPLLFRIGFVIAGFMGWGILAYLVLWIALPRPEPGRPVGSARTTSAIRIAEERFARGEIDAAQLAQIREDLLGGRA